MKTIYISILALLLVMGIVSATETTLSEDYVSMGYNDVRNVNFCIDDVGGQQNIAVVVDPVCKELDGNYGCQVGDGDATGLFSAVPVDLTINEGECTTIILTTTINDPEDAGVFYYTVNGQVGGSTIGVETGTVIVPEFGVIASMGLLAGVGVFIYFKRRKDE